MILFFQDPSGLLFLSRPLNISGHLTTYFAWSFGSYICEMGGRSMWYHCPLVFELQSSGRLIWWILSFYVLDTTSLSSSGECKLENMRTLCVACHADVTAEQCADRRKTRNKAKNLLKGITSGLINEEKPRPIDLVLEVRWLSQN